MTMYRTILFTDNCMTTTGMVVISVGPDGCCIERHAEQGGEYIHAFLLEDGGFLPLYSSTTGGMTVQDAIDRLASAR